MFKCIVPVCRMKFYDLTWKCGKYCAHARDKGNSLEAPADEVHEEHVGTSKGYREVLTARPPLLAFAVCHASRAAFLICREISRAISLSRIAQLVLFFFLYLGAHFRPRSDLSVLAPPQRVVLAYQKRACDGTRG